MSLSNRHFTPWASACIVAAITVTIGACKYPVSPSGSGSSDSDSGSTQSSGPLTYVADIQPILSISCVICHGPSRHEAGYNFSTYPGVMKAVTPGSANSKLIQVTKPGGIMFGELAGGAAESQIIRDWIVVWNAREK